MKLNREAASGILLVDAHDPQSITVRGVAWSHSLLITPDGVQAWAVAGFAALDAASLAAACALQPAVLLIGTGVRQRFPAPAVLRPLIEARIGFEIMDTGAACRTYNLLASEGRRVAAALILEVAA
ncbi:Mth938-like domain-containing protein [Uliginosibacterium aquaticum]|uniref:Xcc1710-like domain-containing protein n=1 Tax=Uliginosibacterium aquaticum TaxID=2731212 RepID=A0ABX2IJ65_9RHOO|nr:MTH938/NDUFAF3 family protein [Uliginosibacterium aquaticum]NSL54371.1 hypothetical protein [Uliginosibacterium aquaticum]